MIRSWLAAIARVAGWIPAWVEAAAVVAAVVLGFVWLLHPVGKLTLKEHFRRIAPLIGLLALLDALMVPAASFIVSRGQTAVGGRQFSGLPFWIVVFAIYPGNFLAALADVAIGRRFGPRAGLAALAALFLVLGAPITLRLQSGAFGDPWNKRSELAKRFADIEGALGKFREDRGRYPSPAEGIAVLVPKYLPRHESIEDLFRVTGTREFGYGTADPARGAIVTSYGVDYDDDMDEASYSPGDGRSAGLPAAGLDLGSPPESYATLGMIVLDAGGDFYLIVGEPLAR